MKTKSILQILLLSAVWGISFLLIRIAGNTSRRSGLRCCGAPWAQLYCGSCLVSAAISCHRAVCCTGSCSLPCQQRHPLHALRLGRAHRAQQRRRRDQCHYAYLDTALTMALHRTRAALLTIGGVLLGFSGGVGRRRQPCRRSGRRQHSRGSSPRHHRYRPRSHRLCHRYRPGQGQVCKGSTPSVSRPPNLVSLVSWSSPSPSPELTPPRCISHRWPRSPSSALPAAASPTCSTIVCSRKSPPHRWQQSRICFLSGYLLGPLRARVDRLTHLPRRCHHHRRPAPSESAANGPAGPADAWSAGRSVGDPFRCALENRE